MFGHQYYHGLLRKYIVLFGKVFTDIVIERKNKEGTKTNIIKVPIMFAAKDKTLSRVKQDPALDKETALTLPRMAFMYESGWRYDGERKLGARQQHVKRDPTKPNTVATLYNEVPYNIPFTLYILTEHAEDGAKIVEQILPRFTPEWNASVELIPEMGIFKDIPIVLNDVVPNDQFEGEYQGRRIVGWELRFTMKAYFFGPVIEKPIIKFADVNWYIGTEGDKERAFGTQTTPGLTANGEPTSNPAESINPLDIFYDSDWGYAERFKDLDET